VDIINTRSHLQKFDFLRGAAILLVLTVHAWVGMFYPFQFLKYKGFWLDYKAHTARELFTNFFPFAFGWTGVELFLIISGFLIHYGYMNSKKFNFLLYFNKRFLRIYPPYLFALLFFAFETGLNTTMKDFFYHIFLIHNFDEQTISGINSSFWSLALEFQLYLIYPLFLYTRKKMGMGKSVIIIAAISLILSILRIIYNFESLAYQTSVFRLWIVWVMGAFLAEKYVKGQRLANLKCYHLILILLFLISLSFTILYKYFSAFYFTIFYILFIDWFINRESDIRNVILKKLYAFVVFAGLCSYSLYLIHKPLLDNLLRYFNFMNLRRIWSPFKSIDVVIIFFVLGLLSHSLYTFIELPSIRFGKYFYKRFLMKTDIRSPKVMGILKEGIVEITNTK